MKIFSFIMSLFVSLSIGVVYPMKRAGEQLEYSYIKKAKSFECVAQDGELSIPIIKNEFNVNPLTLSTCLENDPWANRMLATVMIRLAENELDKRIKCDSKKSDKLAMAKVEATHCIRTRTIKKPYICMFKNCARAFISKLNLDRHTRIHTGKNLFVCAFKDCDKAFVSNVNLINHVRVHTGERPYACTFKGCDKLFAQKSNLTKHKKKHMK